MDCSNETLAAIVAGLAPSRSDEILCISGSGDQPFALCESGARIFAVDIIGSEIAEAQRRAGLIASGAFSALRDTVLLEDMKVRDANLAFFSNERLSRIRASLDNITWHVADIFKLPTELKREYDKVYLSNATGYLPFTLIGRDPAGMRELAGLAMVRHIVKKGGLVYSSEYDGLRLGGALRKTGYVCERERTMAAHMLERDARWEPTVYRRI